MKRMTRSNAEELAAAADEASSYLSDLNSAITEWLEAKEEGGTEEAREAAAFAREEIDSALESLEVALGDLGYQKERSA